MVLLILSKGAQRRKSGEKRKDRKKEATEEEKGCPEKEKLVVCHLETDHSALCSALCKFALPPPPGQDPPPPAPWTGAQTPLGDSFPTLVATPAPVFMCF
jgi:hypothetical protein